jgi:hypothetical protein
MDIFTVSPGNREKIRFILLILSEKHSKKNQDLLNCKAGAG